GVHLLRLARPRRGAEAHADAGANEGGVLSGRAQPGARPALGAAALPPHRRLRPLPALLVLGGEGVALGAEGGRVRARAQARRRDGAAGDPARDHRGATAGAAAAGAGTLALRRPSALLHAVTQKG